MLTPPHGCAQNQEAEHEVDKIAHNSSYTGVGDRVHAKPQPTQELVVLHLVFIDRTLGQGAQGSHLCLRLQRVSHVEAQAHKGALDRLLRRSLRYSFNVVHYFLRNVLARMDAPAIAGAEMKKLSMIFSTVSFRSGAMPIFQEPTLCA